MEKIKSIIERKPAFFVICSLTYLFIAAFLKWKTNVTENTFLFIAGGITGIYFLDLAEEFFQLNPSPLRSIVFCAAFMVVSLFVVTSSSVILAAGLVLSMYLNIILRLVGQWKLTGNLKDWFAMLANPVSRRKQGLLLIGFICIFIWQSWYFIF